MDIDNDGHIERVIPFNSQEEADNAAAKIASIVDGYEGAPRVEHGLWVIPSPRELDPDWRSKLADSEIMPSDMTMIVGQTKEEYRYG